MGSDSGYHSNSHILERYEGEVLYAIQVEGRMRTAMLETQLGAALHSAADFPLRAGCHPTALTALSWSLDLAEAADREEEGFISLLVRERVRAVNAAVQAANAYWEAVLDVAERAPGCATVHEHEAFALMAECDSIGCLLYTSPSPRDRTRSRMPSSA